MASRVFWRRSATAGWVYIAVVLGILGTVVAARVLGLEEFGVYVTALTAVGFFQVLLDLTVEEPLTKFGFRYAVNEEWGKLRRLFVRALQVKFAGGVLAALALVLLAPVADALFGAEDLAVPILVGALLPLVQATENVGATALLLRGRYDLRGAYQAFAMALRLAAIAIGAPYGVTATLAAMVVAQAIATVAVSAVGLAAFRRFPSAPAQPLGADRREVISFTLQSSLGTGVVSLAHHARSARARNRRRADPGRPLPDRPDAADGPRGGQLSCAPRSPHRPDAGLGARPERGRARRACGSTRSSPPR